MVITDFLMSRELIFHNSDIFFTIIFAGRFNFWIFFDRIRKTFWLALNGLPTQVVDGWYWSLRKQGNVSCRLPNIRN
jgi:hypothetical protein